MSSDLPESDWRCFKEVHSKALERYCCRILEEVAVATRGSEGTAHERYLKIFSLINEHNEQMAKAFDDFRRSTAVMQLAIMRRMELLTASELGQFSEQTRIRVEDIASL
ncbi:MAG TPA: peptide ABC transporter substrate-binding protein [Verrucomicrobiae bacterium]|nr:peptide ABC transporter substrate-binding protein [Verrucomicrobiae bacterium]